MDHGSLRGFFKFHFIICLSFLGIGCSTHESLDSKSDAKTYIVTAATPEKALLLSEHYLEWNKGIDISIRDHNRGVIVTDWTTSSPHERYRVTLRSTRDAKGSVLSSHTEYQVLENTNWKDIPSPSEWESRFLAELSKYIDSRLATGKK